jgi:hypothetical protein
LDAARRRFVDFRRAHLPPLVPRPIVTVSAVSAEAISRDGAEIELQQVALDGRASRGPCTISWFNDAHSTAKGGAWPGA